MPNSGCLDVYIKCFYLNHFILINTWDIKHQFINPSINHCLPIGNLQNNSGRYITVHRVITVFAVFRLLTDFVCLYTYEFWLSLCKIVRSSVILLLPFFTFSLFLTNFNFNDIDQFLIAFLIHVVMVSELLLNQQYPTSSCKAITKFVPPAIFLTNKPFALWNFELCAF